MASCGDVGCTNDKPEEAQAAKDRVEYPNKPVNELTENIKVTEEDEKKEAKVDDNQEVVQEEESLILVQEEKTPILVQMLSENLIRKDGDKYENVATSKLLDTEVIALFFSAEYCPHCRDYKKILAKAYDNLKSLGKSFEIVFISHDRNQGDYDKHYSDMDYLALPFSERLKKGKLARRFDVEEIPRLVMIDPKTGQATNRDADQDVQDDKKFPFTNARSLLELMDDAVIINKKKEQIVFRDMRQRYIVLFICASSALCRRLLPTLKSWYDKFQDKLEETDRSFEVLFVSWDDDEEAFEVAFEMMPWAAMSFKEQEKKRKLIKFLRLKAYPHVIVIDKLTNRVVTNEGRSKLVLEEESKSEDTAFPWAWSLYGNMNEQPRFFNLNPCIMAWLLKKTVEEQEEKKKMLAHIAKEYVEPNCCRGIGFLYLTELVEKTKIPNFLNEYDLASGFTLIDYDAGVKYSDELTEEKLRSVLEKYNNEDLNFD